MNGSVDPSRIELNKNMQHKDFDQTTDLTVLVQVLNERQFQRQAIPYMQNQQFDGNIEYLFIDGEFDDGISG